LINVLAKPQLENTILLSELIDIMENLGIPESGFSANGDGDDDDKHDQDDVDNKYDQAEAEESPEPVNSEKTKKKGLDLNSLTDDSKNLLLNFLIFLESENMSVANFFADVKYEQQVKTKKKQSTVDIVPAEDFFRLIEENYEIVSDVNLTEQVKSELQDLL
jgi:hypothetical protein